MSDAIITRNSLQLKHDGVITIATGASRKTKLWKNKEVQWSDFVARLSKTNRTGETLAEYLAMPKEKQGAVKDVGGFVGGSLKKGLRIPANVAWRHVITLDADFAGADFWELVPKALPCACCI